MTLLCAFRLRQSCCSSSEEFRITGSEFHPSHASSEHVSSKLLVPSRDSPDSVEQIRGGAPRSTWARILRSNGAVLPDVGNLADGVYRISRRGGDSATVSPKSRTRRSGTARSRATPELFCAVSPTASCVPAVALPPPVSSNESRGGPCAWYESFSHENHRP